MNFVPTSEGKETEETTAISFLELLQTRARMKILPVVYDVELDVSLTCLFSQDAFNQAVKELRNYSYSYREGREGERDEKVQTYLFLCLCQSVVMQCIAVRSKLWYLVCQLQNYTKLEFLGMLCFTVTRSPSHFLVVLLISF